MKKTDLPNFWHFFEEVKGKEREPPDKTTAEADGIIEENGTKQRKQK